MLNASLIFTLYVSHGCWHIPMAYSWKLRIKWIGLVIIENLSFCESRYLWSSLKSTLRKAHLCLFSSSIFLFITCDIYLSLCINTIRSLLDSVNPSVARVSRNFCFPSSKFGRRVDRQRTAWSVSPTVALQTGRESLPSFTEHRKGILVEQSKGR